MTKASSTGNDNAGSDSEPTALLVELEFVGFNCRQLMFNSASKLLGDKDVTLTRPLFSRFFMRSSMRQALTDFLAHQGKGRVSAERMEETMCENVSSQLLAPASGPLPAFTKLIKRASQKNLVLGALSCMPLEQARQLASRAEFPENEGNLVSLAESGRCCPGIDTWMRLAKSIGIPAARCMAVATSEMSSRAALAAGMRCAAIADQYSAHQDFSGCDYVFDALDDDAVKTIVDFLSAD